MEDICVTGKIKNINYWVTWKKMVKVRIIGVSVNKESCMKRVIALAEIKGL